MAMLITVGGTGQHIALAAMRLQLLGALPSDLTLFAIDAASESSVSKCLKSPWNGISVGDNHPMRLQRIDPPFSDAGYETTTFEDLFESDLVDGFFAPEEARIPIHHGMFGTPAVGATVAAGAFDDQIGATLRALPRQPFFVAGSVIGGTGAGVMHRILQLLANAHDPENVFGIFLLRWFDVPPGGQVDGSVMSRNEHLGLRFLLDTTSSYMKAGIVIGPPQETTALTAPKVVSGDQEIIAIYPLAACLALLSIEPAVVTQADVGVWTLSHDEQRESWFLDHPWHRGIPLRKRYFWALHVKLMLEFLLSNYDTGAITKAIYGMLGGGAAAVTDCLYKSVRSHFGSARADGDAGLSEMAQRWRQYVARVDFCCNWLRGLFPELATNTGSPSLLRTRLGAGQSLAHENFFNSPLNQYFGSAVPLGTRPLSPAELADEFIRRIVAGTEGELQ